MRYPNVWVVSLATITNRGLPKRNFSRNYKIRVGPNSLHRPINNGKIQIFVASP